MLSSLEFLEFHDAVGSFRPRGKLSRQSGLIGDVVTSEVEASAWLLETGRVAKREVS